MARVLVIPRIPQAKQMEARSRDPRYLEGQRLLAEAIRHLVQADPRQNRSAIALLSEHFRTRFRMSDKPPLTTKA
jgi:hypothetical protein